MSDVLSRLQQRGTIYARHIVAGRESDLFTFYQVAGKRLVNVSADVAEVLDMEMAPTNNPAISLPIDVVYNHVGEVVGVDVVLI